ncbi:MAG TPA: FadD3 family acyl-CoA ligase [Acidimicrobiales bacterium]|nr:FadD3 family acyl-CoA ligase [Acidimicrobiales bacterium]
MGTFGIPLSRPAYKPAAKLTMRQFPGQEYGRQVRGDLEWGTIPRLVRVAAERYLDVEALVDGAMRLTFADLADAVVEATGAAISAGIEPGDRAAIWAPNSGQWVIAALGLLSAGAVLVPLNTRFKGQEAAYILGKSGARALFTVNGFLGTDYVALLESANVDLGSLQVIVVLQGNAPVGTVGWSNYLAAGSVVTADDAQKRAESVRGDDLSDIIFTSGTTGRPKGAMLTHAQTLRVFADWSAIVGLSEGDRYLIVNPFFHTFGYKAGFLACLIRGATIVPHAVFDVGTVLAQVAEERISMLPGPPTLFQSILNHPDRDAYDLSSLRLAVTGAAAVPVQMIRRMREELTFKRIITGYGLTESCGTAAMCREDDDPETIANFSGRAIPDTELRIVDDHGNEVAHGTHGEVVTRGYHVMKGYLDEPEETANAIDVDGWLHTGDIGVMDERGYIQITDRKKDMFIAGGFNAYPAEIEGVLLRHPSVGQIAVVGAPDDRLGEVGMAFVVPRQGVSVDPTALLEWARGQMANYKVPRYLEVVDELPLNAVGKVLKYELRERARSLISTG